MSALDTIRRRPLSQPSIDAIHAAAWEADALPVPVFWHGQIHEIGIWQRGEWQGSVFRWTRDGIGAWSSVGDKQKHFGERHDAAVRFALWGTETLGIRRAKARQDGVDASAGISAPLEAEGALA